MGVFLPVAFVLFLAGFIWLCVLEGRARNSEAEQFHKEIAHFPVEVQVRLWASYIRHEAESDLH